MGTEEPMVNTPHADSASASTTTRPSPASATTTMPRMATAVMSPRKGPSSSRAISASDRPPRRTEATRMTKSCTAPPRTTPKRIHVYPGRKPNCAASTGPMSGPAPEIAAKWWPKRTQRLVGW